MYSNRCARDLCIRVLSSWVEPPRVVPSLRIMPSLDVGLVILGRSLALHRLLVTIVVDCSYPDSIPNEKPTTDSVPL
jgi:hypothetical protein